MNHEFCVNIKVKNKKLVTGSKPCLKSKTWQWFKSILTFDINRQLSSDVRTDDHYLNKIKINLTPKTMSLDPFPWPPADTFRWFARPRSRPYRECFRR
jgi:hypothetical protein